MGEFSTAWLDLREPVDTASRDLEFCAALLAWRQTQPLLSVLDLGSGTGAHLRYLAPRLGGDQNWWLIDNDPVLLADSAERLRTWLTPPHLNLRWTTRVVDLARDWRQVTACNSQLVTASALLDLVSAAWLEPLAQQCWDWQAAVYITLSYDGRIVWEPRLDYDEPVREAINRHQRTDKGFGPALGPDAPATLAILLRQYGYWVRLRPSPWRLDSCHTFLQMTLLTGWIEAIKPFFGGQALTDLNHWMDCRRELIARGISRLQVGHWDLFASIKSA
jgi:hypothetical protein